MRVAVIGYRGRMGSHHAAALTRAGHHVVGIDLTDNLDDARACDYAIIVTPTSTHPDLAHYLASWRVPCLIEKPVTADWVTATEIVAHFRDEGVPLAVGMIERFNPVITELRNLWPDLGTIYGITTRRLSPWPGRVTDVGVSLDLGTHDYDLATHLTGHDPSSVAAVSNHVHGVHDDDTHVITRRPTGTIAHHHASWLSGFRERILTVDAEHGTVIADLWHKTLTHVRPDDPDGLHTSQTDTSVGAADALEAEHAAMCLLVEHGDMGWLASGDQAARVTETAETSITQI